MLNYTVEFDLPPRESPVLCYVDKFQLAAVIIGMVVMGIGLLGAMGGYSSPIMWNMLTFLQFVNYMPMAKVFMHTCLVDFCVGMSFFNADLGAVG